MTIQAHVAIEAREFDTKGDYGSNVWADSELREYLQSDEFKERFADLILDTDGCIAEPYGYIYLTDNGFIYEE